MPRQIIDTESSRPRYVRRVALSVAAVIVVLAVLVYLALLVWGHRVPVRGGNASPARVSWQPSIMSPASLAGPPKENPCFVA